MFVLRFAQAVNLTRSLCRDARCPSLAALAIAVAIHCPRTS